MRWLLPISMLAWLLPATPAAGCIAREPIRDVVRGAFTRFHQCVPSHLRPARVTVRFDIEADGHVSNAEVTSTDLESDSVGDDAALECVVGVFLSLTFPPSSRGGMIAVSYPLRFDP